MNINISWHIYTQRMIKPAEGNSSLNKTGDSNDGSILVSYTHTYICIYIYTHTYTYILAFTTNILMHYIHARSQKHTHARTILTYARVLSRHQNPCFVRCLSNTCKFISSRSKHTHTHTHTHIYIESHDCIYVYHLMLT
jgi:hypothetical protein